jgi:hypothetical protein
VAHLHERIVLVEDICDLGSNKAIRGLAFGEELA